jgi:hypothetical protein
MVEELKAPPEKIGKNEYFAKFPPLDLANLVSSATDSSDNTPDDFKCNICLRLVFEPQECRNCNQIYCLICIKTWHKKDQSCPLCKCQGNNFQPIGKLVKSLLDKV